MGSAARAAASIVTAAMREQRGVLRSLCMAVEQAGRAAMRTTRIFEEEGVAAWRPVPRVGAIATWSIAAAARITVGLFSGLVAAMIACDVLLNTAAEWRNLHPRFR